MDAFSTLTLLVGQQEGIRPVKNWVVGAGMVFCLGWGVHLHMAHLMLLPQSLSLAPVNPDWFYLSGPAYCTGNPGQRTVKWVLFVVFCEWKMERLGAFWVLIFADCSNLKLHQLRCFNSVFSLPIADRSGEGQNFFWLVSGKRHMLVHSRCDFFM